MAGWHHRLNGHEFEQAPGDSEGQRSLVCCSPWGHKEVDVTERLNDNNKGGRVGRHWHCSHISCLSTPRARPGPRSCLAAGRVTRTGQFAGEVMRLLSRRTPWEPAAAPALSATATGSVPDAGCPVSLT